MMNGNVNGMTIRLLGCALAMLVLAAMSVTTGSFLQRLPMHTIPHRQTMWLRKMSFGK